MSESHIFEVLESLRCAGGADVLETGWLFVPYVDHFGRSLFGPVQNLHDAAPQTLATPSVASGDSTAFLGRTLLILSIICLSV